MIQNNRILKKYYSDKHQALVVWDDVDREACSEGVAIDRLNAMRPDAKKFNVRGNNDVTYKCNSCHREVKNFVDGICPFCHNRELLPGFNN